MSFSDSILLSADMKVKITDFGTAKVCNQEDEEEVLDDGTSFHFLRLPHNNSLMISLTQVLNDHGDDLLSERLNMYRPKYYRKRKNHLARSSFASFFALFFDQLTEALF